ncbi:SET domain-containing protein [Apiospora phragmitis]|uniref:SET domain-containing protein n=1 Tax=Apiospora phragmitis TaxID=2905665 RepID=A0ABR1UH47_9PEZI
MQAVRSLHSISEAVLSQLPAGLPFHGVLAADLALDKSAGFASWKKLLPSSTDFAASMPFTWPDDLRALLPKAAGEIVQKQHAKFERQWGAVAQAFPSLTWDEYLYFWLLVNTRTFYLETPELEAFPWEDRLALLPVADLFNHADEGCHVAYSAAEGYTITVRRRYEPGEEVFASYGDHPNDLLLAEYGFAMPENKWDYVCLDEVILPRLTPTQIQDLESNGYAGPYMFTADSGLSRHLMAVLQMLASSGESPLALHDDTDKSPELGAAAKELLKVLLGEALEKAQGIRGKIRDLQVGESAQRDMLYHRWEQIERILLQAIGRLN